MFNRLLWEFRVFESHVTGLGPSIQPVQIPLQNLPTLKKIDTPTQLGVNCKLAEGALDPLVQIVVSPVLSPGEHHL